MWELGYKESWAQKNWCFWTVCWRRLLRVPWTARRSNQSILKEISPGCSLEGLMLKLKLQYFGHLIRRADSFEKILMLGKIEGRRRRGQQRMWWLDDITDTMDMGLGGLRELVMGKGGLGCCGSWGRFSRVRLCATHRWQPTKLPHPWDSPGKNTGVDCRFLLQCMEVKSESEVAQSCPTLSDPMDCSLPSSASMGFSRQEYWSGVLLPSLKKLTHLLFY